MVHALMQGVSPINVEGQILILLGTNAFHPQRLQQPRERKVVERILAKALQRPVQIRVTLDKQEEMPDARKQLQHVRTDPLVRRAINIFDAEVTGIEMSETPNP